eukprot:COSAG04_NODE_15577_length_527_cov_1.184579_1_plen_120_part_00
MQAGAIRYIAPVAPGFAKFKPPSLRQWAFPEGSGWAGEPQPTASPLPRFPGTRALTDCVAADPGKVLGLTDCEPELAATLESLQAKAAEAMAADRKRAEAVLARTVLTSTEEEDAAMRH